jgi:hypothetical protein
VRLRIEHNFTFDLTINEVSLKTIMSTSNEEFKNLSAKNWRRCETFAQFVSDLKAGDWVSYTRASYVPRAVFLKRVEDAKEQGITVDQLVEKLPNGGRKKVCCLVVEVGDKLVKVSSIPRKFSDNTREHKISNWTLRDGMKGNPIYYNQIAKKQQE